MSHVCEVTEYVGATVPDNIRGSWEWSVRISNSLLDIEEAKVDDEGFDREPGRFLFGEESERYGSWRRLLNERAILAATGFVIANRVDCDVRYAQND